MNTGDENSTLITNSEREGGDLGDGTKATTVVATGGREEEGRTPQGRGGMVCVIIFSSLQLKH
jgi:hypothetical protein